MSELGPKLCAFFLERSVLLRPLGNTIYVMPPYSIRPQELRKIFSAIAEAGDSFGQPTLSPNN
jgi:adenosylmethionine-8-amino-7-oxononanoate aminotransferase